MVFKWNCKEMGRSPNSRTSCTYIFFLYMDVEYIKCINVELVAMQFIAIRQFFSMAARGQHVHEDQFCTFSSPSLPPNRPAHLCSFKVAGQQLHSQAPNGQRGKGGQHIHTSQEASTELSKPGQHYLKTWTSAAHLRHQTSWIAAGHTCVHNLQHSAFTNAPGQQHRLKFIIGTDLKIFELTCTNFRKDAFQLYKR